MRTFVLFKSIGACKVLSVVALALTGGLANSVSPASTSSSPVTEISAASHGIRRAAVAGLFYPKDPKELARAVDNYLSGAAGNTVSGVRALICPHAGYEYSGPTAARAYKLIVQGGFNRVIILAASHTALFEGASVPMTEAYETPLGRVPVWEKARQLGKQPPFVAKPHCGVQRPPWAALAPQGIQPASEDTPETWEHSVEVQVPFLQRTLKDFKILPVLFGRADPAAVARALAPLVEETTLVIASTDLSHFHNYEEACGLDRQTLKWICHSDIAALQAPGAEDRACGRMPVVALLHLAKLKGWNPQLLDYRNSGDTAGDKSRVVGYSAVVFTSGGRDPGSGTEKKAPSGAQFNLGERQFLLNLARQALTNAAAGRTMPLINSNAVPAACFGARGCFVTLTKSGQLRGCIGNILAAGPLYQCVMENARSAALRDPRFPPVSADEAAGLHIEISLLTEPEPLAFSSAEDLVAKLQPGRDGVVLKIGERGATFLPQVWDQLPDKTQFLSHLAAKAGCAPNAWRGNDVSVSIYHVEAFEEPN